MIHYLRIAGDPVILDLIPGYLEDRDLTGSAIDSGTLYLYFPGEGPCDEAAEFLKNEFGQIELSIVKMIGEEKNWNKLWESNFEPVLIPPSIYIRAEFHPANPAVKNDILIKPEMAFGTGHHATTFLMAKELQEIDLINRKVLDFGCGTGILSIIASKLGASQIDAVDIEKEAVTSTKRNASINRVKNVHVVQGSLEQIETRPYDIILANINKNVHLKYADKLGGYAGPGTLLLISGILPEDINEIVKALDFHWSLENQWTKDGWVLLKFQKR